MELLFPFADSWWLYAGFTGLVLGLLAVDLGVFHRRAHEVSFRESVIWSIVCFTTGCPQLTQCWIPTRANSRRRKS